MGKDSIDEILASVPPRAPRSRLEPYRELIEELRRRGVSFREIAEILFDRCNVRVTRAAVHDFLKIRKGTIPRGRIPAARSTPNQIFIYQEEALEGNEKTFEFDESKPLRIAGRRK